MMYSRRGHPSVWCGRSEVKAARVDCFSRINSDMCLQTPKERSKIKSSLYFLPSKRAEKAEMRDVILHVIHECVGHFGPEPE